jgi:hypothetical protein
MSLPHWADIQPKNPGVDDQSPLIMAQKQIFLFFLAIAQSYQKKPVSWP